MKINLEFAELDHPLFLGGKNMNTKLYANSQSGITLVYARSLGELWITYNGKTAIVASERAYMVPVDGQDIFTLDGEIEKKSVPTMQRQQSGKMNKFETNPLAKAQVGTPMGAGESLG